MHSLQNQKTAISAHFFRVAAEFTGREKYKTPSRAHGCLRRAGKRDKAVEFAIVPEEVLIPTAVLGVIEHVAGNSARISEKVMQSATSSAGSYRRRTSGGFSLFPGARKLSCARRDHVQGFKAAKRSQNEPLFQIRADASHIFAFSRLHLNPARIQPWVVYDSQ
jgi:hypothetical protein